MNKISIIREHEHKILSELCLNGLILDLGGSKKSGYQELIKGENTFVTVNYGQLHPGCDLSFDIENKFPLEDKKYDHVLTMNVLEHIYNYRNVFSETARVIKSGGMFVSTVPFMHHVHGSPDDFHRYTESTFRRLAHEFKFEVVEIKPLGFGLFSLIFQTIGGFVPTALFRFLLKKCCVYADSFLLHFKRYRNLRARIPLGYYVVLKKI